MPTVNINTSKTHYYVGTKAPFPPMYICTYHAFITHRSHCYGNIHIITAHILIPTTVRCMKKVTIITFRDLWFSENRQVYPWIFCAHHRDGLAGSGYRLTVSGHFTVAKIVEVKTQRPWAATLSHDMWIKGSARIVVLHSQTTILFWQLVWLHEKIHRDTGATGIMEKEFEEKCATGW